MILLIRHAEKLTPPKQGLTSKGIQDAFKYGVFLKKHGYTFDDIISSPVERCLQTAEGIAKGLTHNTSVRTSQLLGDPGAFVTDDKLAAGVFEAFTVHEVINKMLYGEALSGFASVDEGSKILANKINLDMKAGKSTLYISHDAIIMPFIARQLSISQIQKKDIVGYLGGFRVQEAHNKSIERDFRFAPAPHASR